MGQVHYLQMGTNFFKHNLSSLHTVHVRGTKMLQNVSVLQNDLSNEHEQPLVCSYHRKLKSAREEWMYD